MSKNKNPKEILKTACPGFMGSPLSRREMLKQGANGFGLLALSSLMADKAYAGLVSSATPHFPPKIKNVILCYMPGGVSHMDTFDPKPKLDELHGKPSGPMWQSGDRPRTWLKCCLLYTSDAADE